MRRPSDRRELYRWWATALKAIEHHKSLRSAKDKGAKVPPIPDDPQCGFYCRRMKVGGPFVEARIFLEQKLTLAGELAADEVMKCQIGEDFFDPADQWPFLANRPISQKEYRFGVGYRRWNQEQTRDVPDPDITIDFLTIAPPMLKKRTTRHGTKRNAGRRAGGNRA